MRLAPCISLQVGSPTPSGRTAMMARARYVQPEVRRVFSVHAGAETVLAASGQPFIADRYAEVDDRALHC